VDRNKWEKVEMVIQEETKPNAVSEHSSMNTDAATAEAKTSVTMIRRTTPILDQQCVLVNRSIVTIALR